jgi:hypothetical protein
MQMTWQLYAIRSLIRPLQVRVWFSLITQWHAVAKRWQEASTLALEA